MNKNQSTGHLSRFFISKILADEMERSGRQPSSLPVEKASHLAQCLECQATLAEARAQSESFALKFPTFASLDAVAQQRNAKAAKQKVPANADLLGKMLQSLRDFIDGLNTFWARTALAALVILGSGTWLWQNAQFEKELEYTAKGSSAPQERPFYLFLNGKQIHGDSLRGGPSDTLQLGIVSSRPVYYAVLFRDDENALGAAMGGSENNVLPVGNSNGESLPKSLILDGKWKREILYCLWSDRPFSLEEAKAKTNNLSNKESTIHIQPFFIESTTP